MNKLTDPLPLRSTAELGNFHNVKAIPYRYGETTGELTPINATRTRFVWADHPVKGIDAVTVDGVQVSGWEFLNLLDETTGRGYAAVDFAEPVDAAASVAATGRGKMAAADGTLLENPADVVADVLTLAGRPELAARLATFRRLCYADGLRVAGSITAASVDAAPTAQAAVRSICASVGASFAVRGREPCWLPGRAASLRTVDCERLDVSLRASLEMLATSIVVNYAFDDAGAAKSVKLTATAAAKRFGDRLLNVSLPFVADSLTAFNVASAMLQRLARLRWEVELDGMRSTDLRSGDSVTLTNCAVGSTVSRVDLESCATQIDAGVQSATGVAFVGIAPRVDLVWQAARFEAAAFASVAIALQGTERVLTLTEESGEPIADAAVTLNGEVTRYTDGSGRVAFPVSLMPPGEHTLRIVTNDDPPRTLTTTVIVQ